MRLAPLGVAVLGSLDLRDTYDTIKTLRQIKKKPMTDSSMHNRLGDKPAHV